VASGPSGAKWRRRKSGRPQIDGRGKLARSPGYRRVALQLARWGVAAGLELVRALMRELGLVACQPRPWRPSTTKQGQAGPVPDLVARDFSASVPGEKMVGDITYIRPGRAGCTWRP
jgi:hypothetical protein